MANRALANKVKLLREQKAWSQSHLARAAGLSTRTVQRVENRGDCSKETMLSLAAAFDVDVEELTATKSDSNTHSQRQRTYFSMGSHTKDQREEWQKAMAFTGIALLLLPLSFFAVNVLQYELGFTHIFNPFDYLFKVDFIQTVSPAVFLGGLGMAGFLNLFPFIDLDVRQNDTGFLSSLRYSGNCWNGLILGISLLLLGLMVGYVAIENISEHAVQMSMVVD